MTYANWLDPDHLRPSSYDLVNSYIVLQHIPVATGETTIQQLIAAVKPGGIGALHMTFTLAISRICRSLCNLIKRGLNPKFLPATSKASA